MRNLLKADILDAAKRDVMVDVLWGNRQSAMEAAI